MRFLGISLLALALVDGCSGTKPAKASHPLTRKIAPEIEVRLQNGDTFRPHDAAGKVLVLDYWATWCGPCKESFPKIDAIYRKHKAKGLEVVAINEDEDPKGVPQFLKDTGVSFVIAFDDKQKAAEAFGVETMPSTFIVDRQGVVRYVHSGYHVEDAVQIEAEIEELLGAGP